MPSPARLSPTETLRPREPCGHFLHFVMTDRFWTYTGQHNDDKNTPFRDSRADRGNGGIRPIFDPKRRTEASAGHSRSDGHDLSRVLKRGAVWHRFDRPDL